MEGLLREYAALTLGSTKPVASSMYTTPNPPTYSTKLVPIATNPYRFHKSFAVLLTYLTRCHLHMGGRASRGVRLDDTLKVRPKQVMLTLCS